MDSNARANPARDRGGLVEGDSGLPETAEVGRLSGTATSVHARWRVDTVAPDFESNASLGGSESDQITLVQVRLENPDPVEQHVSVRNALDGPVLFPRRRGVPEAGWSRDGFVGPVSAESGRALGYACPAPVQTPPIELEQADEIQRATEAEFGATPAAVVRTHGAAAPPAAVVREDDRGPADERDTLVSTPDRSDVGGGSGTAPERDTTEQQRDPESTPPDAVTAWLDEIESRVVRAEHLEDAAVADATAILVETDGLEPALEEIERLPKEATQLRALAARATDLADRAETVDVPDEPLRRLA